MARKRGCGQGGQYLWEREDRLGLSHWAILVNMRFFFESHAPVTEGSIVKHFGDIATLLV